MVVVPKRKGRSLEPTVLALVQVLVLGSRPYRGAKGF